MDSEVLLQLHVNRNQSQVENRLCEKQSFTALIRKPGSRLYVNTCEYICVLGVVHLAYV